MSCVRATQPDTPSPCKVVSDRLKYFSHGILGKGGFASVYKGEFDGVKVAVKQILLNSGTSSIEAELRLAQFGKETWHQHLVRYLHQEMDRDFLYIAMELCAGTLDDLIQKRIPNVPSFDGPKEEILRQITDGVQFLHSYQIVHRNITPRNILISDSGTVKLAGFTVSKQKIEDATSFEFDGNIGTPGWAAPEFLNDNIKEFNFQVDVFSLGCVFCYVLTGGKHPFGDRLERDMNVTKGEMKKHILDSITNEKLRKTIVNMLSMKPERRPRIKLIHLKLLKCLLEIYVANLDEHGDEFMKTIDRVTEHYTAEDPTAGWISESLLPSMCKTTSKNKFISLEKALAVSDILRIDINLAALFAKSAATDIIDLTKLVLTKSKKKVNLRKRKLNGDDVITVAIKHFALGQKNEKRLNDLVKLLLENGADPHVINNDGWCPITLACRYYQMDDLIDLLRLLIGHGASPNDRRAACGNTALTLVAQYYQHDNLADVMSVLLEAGADVNSRTNENWNALMLLCRYFPSADGLLPSVQLLVREGIKVHRKSEDDGRTALHLITMHFGNDRNERLSDIVRVLLESEAEADYCDVYGATPLHLACAFYQKDDSIQVIRLLIKYGAKPDGRLLDGGNALTVATQFQVKQDNITEMLNVLIENGTDVNCKSSHGLNALMLLCRFYESDKGLLPAIELLIKKGVNVNHKSEDGSTALHFLTRYFGNHRNERLSDIVRILLENGAEADVTNNDGWISLHLACRYYQRDDVTDVIRLLVEHGAKPDSRLSDGHNALTLATQYQTRQENLVEIMEILMDAGADVNCCKTFQNWNALMNLCRYCENPESLLPSVKLLVQKGVDVNAKAENGWTALHFLTRCFENNRIERLSDVVRILLQSGAKAHFSNCYGWTPLLFSRRFYKREDTNELIQLLVKHGAKIDRKDSNACTLVTRRYSI